jgi:hypothetical protein
VRRTLPGKDEESDVVKFSTFCPKLLAGIDNGQIPPTIADRCITITLKRKRKDQEVARFLPRKVEPQAEELRSAIITWVTQNLEGIMTWEPDTDEEFVEALSDRAFEIAEPLIQIAMQAGGEYATIAKAAVVKLHTSNVTKPQTPEQKTLQAARDYLLPDDDMPRNSIHSATLADMMGVNAKQIGAWLAKFEITPNIITTGGTRARGYHRTQFEDAWERYL